MWQKVLRTHGGKYRPVFIVIHISLSVATVFLCKSLQTPTQSSIFQWSIFFLSNFFYILVAYMNPGYIRTKPLSKQVTSSTIKVSSPRADNEDRVEALESGNSDFHDERFRNSSEVSNNSQPAYLEDASYKESFNSDRLRSRNSDGMRASVTSSLSPKKRTNYKIERISMPKPQVLDDDEIVVHVKDFEFSSRFCLVCNVDQPVRARHCPTCKKCVFKWDHHCTWLGNCIGEKNHLTYFLYLIAQAVELVSALYFLISEIREGVHMIFTVLLLILLCPVCLFCLFLTFFHCYLVGKNLTTVECVAWQKTFYLTGKSKSPFDQGCLKNVLIFCSFPRVRDWNRYLVNV